MIIGLTLETLTAGKNDSTDALSNLYIPKKVVHICEGFRRCRWTSQTANWERMLWPATGIRYILKCQCLPTMSSIH